MIKNIIFDLGNVVFSGNSASVLKKLKIRNENIEEIKEKFFKDYSNLDLGKETLEQHFYKSNLSTQSDQNVKSFLINYYKYRDMNTKIIELIHKLKNNKYGIYVLSNNNKEASEYIKKLPELSSVDGWVISCDIHAVKPNKEIYKALFDKFELNPEECFFIDDKERNIEAGKQFGMDGHVLNYDKYDIKALMNNLRKVGVIV